jgi:hypothetical protein
MAFNAQENLEYIEKQLAYFMYLVGLNPESLDAITIDELLAAARDLSKVDKEISSAFNINKTQMHYYAGTSEDVYLKNQRIFLILNIRRLWYWRQLAIGALSREQ